MIFLHFSLPVADVYKRQEEYVTILKEEKNKIKEI